MIVKQQFQECVHITAFSLEFLRHGDADNPPLVDFGKIERAGIGAEHFCYFRRQKVLQIVGGGFADTAELFFGLI